MLTSGQVADCIAGATLLEQLPVFDVLHANKGYDANAILVRLRSVALCRT